MARGDYIRKITQITQGEIQAENELSAQRRSGPDGTFTMSPMYFRGMTEDGKLGFLREIYEAGKTRLVTPDHSVTKIFRKIKKDAGKGHHIPPAYKEALASAGERPRWPKAPAVK